MMGINEILQVANFINNVSGGGKNKSLLSSVGNYMNPWGSTTSSQEEDGDEEGFDPPPLVPITGLKGGAVSQIAFGDLTKQLWQKYQRKTIDLKKPLCLGREDEFKRLTILLTTNQPTVMIEGATGVGKTTFIEELARRILMGLVPDSLKGCRIVTINCFTIPTFVRILFRDLGKKVIFFIDEMHDADLREWKTLSSEGCPIIFATDRTPLLVKYDTAWKRRIKTLQLGPLSLETCLQVLSTDTLKNELSQRLGRSIDFEEAAIRLALKMAPELEPDMPILQGGSFILQCTAIAYYLASPENNSSILFSEFNIRAYIRMYYKLEPYQLNELVAKVDRLSLSQIPPEELLSRRTRNLTFDPISDSFEEAYGRGVILDSIAYALSAAKSNNVLLVGEPGVGKTHIVEGLVWRMKQGLCPALEGYEVLEVDIDVFREPHDLKAFIDSVIRMSNAGKRFILVIDEIHRLLLKAGEDGKSSVMEDLKVPLGQGKFHLLGITTPLEGELFLKNPAFERRFVIKTIPALTFEETLMVLERVSRRIAATYDRNGHLDFSAELLTDIVHLSKIYPTVNGRPGSSVQPAAAIKLFDILYSYYSNTRGLHSEFNSDFVVRALTALELAPAEEVRKNLEELQVLHSPSERLIPRPHPIFNFCTSLTASALKGEIIPVPGRDEYLQQMCRVLAHHSCNNVILFGQAGIGKTTLVNNLAYELITNPQDFPENLRHKPLLFLEMSKLSGPQDFKRFVESLISIKGKYILFVDELHLLFSINPLTGRAPIEDIKNPLAEGLTLIGSTTSSDLNFDELDDTLKSRFSPITLPTPTPEELYEMAGPTRARLINDTRDKHRLALTIPDDLIRSIVHRLDLIRTPRNLIRILETSVQRAIQRYQAGDRRDGREELTLQDIVIHSAALSPSKWRGWLPTRNFFSPQPLPILTRFFFGSSLVLHVLRTIVKVATVVIVMGFVAAMTLRYIPRVPRPRIR